MDVISRNNKDDSGIHPYPTIPDMKWVVMNVTIEGDSFYNPLNYRLIIGFDNFANLDQNIWYRQAIMTICIAEILYLLLLIQWFELQN